jgi:hypothetical protein
MLLYIQHHTSATNNYADYLRLSSQKMSTIQTAEAVEKQGRAMRASAFEVGLFDPTAAHGVMLPRVWDLDTSLRVLAALKEFSRPQYLCPAVWRTRSFAY